MAGSPLPISPFITHIFTLNDDDFETLNQLSDDRSKYLYIMNTLFSSTKGDHLKQLCEWIIEITQRFSSLNHHIQEYLIDMLIKYRVEIIIREASKQIPNLSKLLVLLLINMFSGKINVDQITDDIRQRTVCVSGIDQIRVINCILPRKEIYSFVNTLISIIDQDESSKKSTLPPLVKETICQWLETNQPPNIKSASKE